MLKKILNRYSVDNIEELFSLMSKKLRKEEVPDEYAAKVANGEELNPTRFELKEILENKRLSHILPYEWFDAETNIYQTNRAYGFILECGSISGAPANMDEQLRGLFSLGIPDGTCMQVLLLASSELEGKFSSYRAMHKSRLLQKVADSRINFYRSGLKKSLKNGYKLPVRDFKLVISFAFDGLYNEDNKSALLSLQSSIRSILKSAMINNQLMQPTSLINLLREILCTSSKPLEPHHYKPNLPIRSQIADIDDNIYVAADALCINDIGVKSIGVIGYPDEFRLYQCPMFIGDMFQLAKQISYPFLITQNIQFLNSTVENTKLSGAAAKTEQQIKPGKLPALFPLFHKKHAEYQLMKKMISSGEGFMRMSHAIHVYYPLGESENAYQEVKSLYKSFGWEVVPNSNLQLPALLCSLPLFHDPASAKDQVKNDMLPLYSQTNVVNTMPLFSDYKGTGNPFLMLLSANGQLMFFDFFQSNTNYNGAVSADSGAGKSFFTNEIAKSARARGDQVDIIDVGRSYKDLCSLLDGQYIEFTREAAMCVNPFSFIKFKIGLDENTKAEEINNLQDLDLREISKEQLLNMEDLDDQIVMLTSIFLVSAGIAENDSRYQLSSSFFEQAILTSLQKHQTNSTFTTVYDELLAMDDDSGIARMLAESIKTYTVHGIFGRYFEGKSTLNMNSGFRVLELEELQGKGQLKFVVLLILMLKITQDMYLSPREIRKMCIIDEAWDLMAGGNTGKFIMTGYRRARKYNGSFITITQKIDDYSENTTTAACYSNSAIKIMLKQGIPKTVELDEYSKKLIQSLKSEPGVFSELIIEMNNGKTLCRFIVDDFTQMLYSTKAEDITLLNYVKESEQLDTVDALDRLQRLRSSFAERTNCPREHVTTEMLSLIQKYGYKSLLQGYDYE